VNKPVKGIKHRHFSDEFICETLKDVRPGESIKDLCERRGIRTNLFYRWRRKAGEGQPQKFPRIDKPTLKPPEYLLTAADGTKIAYLSDLDSVLARYLECVTADGGTPPRLWKLVPVEIRLHAAIKE